MQTFQIAHIVIRDHLYVSGTTEKPEVGVFVQTHTRMRPLKDDMLAAGQTVWMKWNDGPIVAKSKILSWHSGSFKDGNINEMRELCVGTKLFSLNAYWKSVSDKGAGKYTVIMLCDEEWMDKPIYPRARSFGHSWIHLNSQNKRNEWLTHVPEKEIEANSYEGRNIPKGLRFDILKRDNFTCQYCGATAPAVKLHVDHIKPWALVKKHERNNLTTACKDCNLGKSAKIL